MSDYARALEARGIPYELSGGGAFKDSEELRTLLPLLATISDPDDPVPFAAVLRGPLFGVDDEALYRHFRGGRAILVPGRPAAGARPADRPGLRPPARRRAARGRLFRPGPRSRGSAAASGWTAYAGARELGDSRAGNLLKAMAAARTFSGEGLDFAAVVAELDRLTTEGYIEEMSARPGRPGAVRLLTVHGAKGLEAPVVFLADPRPGARPADPVLRSTARRASARGHWRVIRETEGFGVVEVAEPAGWEELEKAEEAFDEAEKLRLLYVAATRAREMLVVSVWKQGKSENAQGPWCALAPYLTEELPEPGAVPRRSRARSASRPSARSSRRSAPNGLAGGRRAPRPTYAVVSVTDVAHAGGQTGVGVDRTRHVLGPGAPRRARGRDARPEGATCASSRRTSSPQEERPAGDLEDVLRIVEGVRQSPLWKRALASKTRLAEVPFALPVAAAELKLAVGPRGNDPPGRDRPGLRGRRRLGPRRLQVRHRHSRQPGRPRGLLCARRSTTTGATGSA